MAWTKRNTQLNGDVINFYYVPSELFLKAQQLSQYHAAANKDKEGNEAIDIAFSSDYKEYFDSFCKKAFEEIGNNFVKVNIRSLIPYDYYYSDGARGGREEANINISDYGFVKDSLLSVLDQVIEKAVVDYVLYKWYEHLGVEELKKKYQGLVVEATITIQGYLWQFLRKVQKISWYPMVSWSNPVCTQMGFDDFTIKWTDQTCVELSNFLVNIKWSDAVCLQNVTDVYSIKWTEIVCVHDTPFTTREIRWTVPVCVQLNNLAPIIKWSDPVCVHLVNSGFEIAWSEELCVQGYAPMELV